MSELPGKLFNSKTYYVLSSINHKADEPVVICIHGIGSYHFHFETLSGYLTEKGYTVLSFDLMGRGYSPFPTEEFDLNGKSIFSAEGHIAQVRELILGLELNKRKYHIIAHSMGGALACLYASRFGDEVLSLTLLSPAGLMDLNALKLVRNCSCLHGMVRRQLLNDSEKAYHSDFYTHTGAALQTENESVEKMLGINQKYPHIFEAFWQSLLHFPLCGIESHVSELAKLHHIRTMIIWGDKDTAVPMLPSMSRYVRIYETAQHPNLHTKIYKNAAHAFFLEYPDIFHADMEEFLQNSVSDISSNEM